MIDTPVSREWENWTASHAVIRTAAIIAKVQGESKASRTEKVGTGAAAQPVSFKKHFAKRTLLC